MQYKMYNSSTPVIDRANTILDNASQDQFEKYMPKEPTEEPVRTFTVAELTDLIKDCADVGKNGGYKKIAMKHKVLVDIVKILEKAVENKYTERFAQTEEV